jgi:hypothetical protein
MNKMRFLEKERGNRVKKKQRQKKRKKVASRQKNLSRDFEHLHNKRINNFSHSDMAMGLSLRCNVLTNEAVFACSTQPQLVLEKKWM